MANTVRRKSTDSEHVKMKLSADLEQKVKYAAKLKGIPPAGYVKTVLAEAVAKDIQEYEFIDLSRQDREAFVKAILEPAEPSKHSIESARHYKKTFGL
jgi:uncharacterized protein (DUF1778 family)